MSSSSGFNDQELQDAESWEIPMVEDPKQSVDDAKTNAFKMRSEWKYEPPEEEIEILPPTAEEIEAIRQAARDEGFEEGKQQGFDEGKAEGIELGLIEGREQGHAEGLQQGLDEGKALVDAQATLWQQLAEKLHQPLSQANSVTQDQLVKLAVSLARGVIRTEITTNEQVIYQALSEGLKALPINQAQYQIHMNPEDVALVKAHFGEATLKEKQWQLVEAPSMERGGCDITTEHNAVDVSIERRTKDVIDRFLLNQGLADD